MRVLRAVKDTAAAALADAFAALSVEGKPVTVRALRERAWVSTDGAGEWLRANRPARDVSPVPADVLARLLDPLWSAAVTAARDEQADADAAERAVLVQAELDTLTARLAAAEAACDGQAEPPPKTPKRPAPPPTPPNFGPPKPHATAGTLRGYGGAAGGDLRLWQQRRRPRRRRSPQGAVARDRPMTRSVRLL